MSKNTKSRKLITTILAVVCCVSLLVGSLAFFTDRITASIKDQKAGTMDLVFNDISASATGTNGITSNNGFAIDKAWENQAIVSAPNINPGDYFDLSYKLSNAGNKSMDVKQLLTVTCSVPMTDTTGYKLTITGEDYNTTAVAGTLSDDGYSITYELDEITLNGSGEGAEVEDGISWTEQTYTARLEFAGASGNEFQGSLVSVSLDSQAKQHRNTDDSVWSDWANYKTEMGQVGEQDSGNGGSGSGTPEIITVYIGDACGEADLVILEAEEGMTWAEFIDSDYNADGLIEKTDEASIESGFAPLRHVSLGDLFIWNDAEQDYIHVQLSDVMLASGDYMAGY